MDHHPSQLAPEAGPAGGTGHTLCHLGDLGHPGRHPEPGGVEHHVTPRPRQVPTIDVGLAVGVDGVADVQGGAHNGGAGGKEQGAEGDQGAQTRDQQRRDEASETIDDTEAKKSATSAKNSG